MGVFSQYSLPEQLVFRIAIDCSRPIQLNGQDPRGVPRCHICNTPVIPLTYEFVRLEGEITD
jgi:hypothetical protein